MDIELPVDEQAELSVLARMMGSINTTNDAFGALTSEDFFFPKHQAIFSAMIDLVKANAEIEPLSVDRIIHEKIPKLADSALVYGLQGYTTHYTDDATHFIEAVKNCSVYRKVIAYSRELMSKAASKKVNPSELNSEMNLAADMIFQSKFDNSVHNLKTSYANIYRDSGLNFIEYFEKKKHDKLNGRCVLSGLPTGYDKLDTLLDGFNRGHYIIIGARPGVGKTTFLMNLMANQAKKGVVVGYLSMEGTIEDAQLAYACLDANVENLKWKHAHYDADEHIRIRHSIEHAPLLYIDDGSGLKISQVVSRIRRMVTSLGVEIVYIDYLGLIRGDQKYPNRQEEMQQVSAGLREIAKKLKIPVVCVCQLNRESEKSNRIPTKSDLRETGQIEQDAMSILLLHRPEQADPMNKPGVLNVHIVKNRYGPEDKISFNFKKTTGRIDELENFILDKAAEMKDNRWNEYDA